MKPLIFYVDDEPHNLTVMEASLPSEWEIRTFSNPLQALEALETVSPWVIISDQRMPGVSGVKYLELAKKIRPHAVRIIVTGYSEEDLVVESVRKAQVFDYIKKPWDADALEASLRRAVEYYRANQEARVLHEQLVEREKVLNRQNIQLQDLTQDLEKAHKREHSLRKELECWVPPFVLWALKENELRFPMKRDIVGLAFDIVGSNTTHKFIVNGRPLRSVIIQTFSEVVLRHGGWRESHAGDSCYAHFGLWDEGINPYEGALASAREFRVALRSVCQAHGINIECGISLHVAKQSIVDVHMVQLITPKGPIVQKSFDTTSIDIDLLHKAEKLLHTLKGSNIVLTGDFVQNLKKAPTQMVKLGRHKFTGDFKPVELYLLPSDQITSEELAEFIKQVSNSKDDSAPRGNKAA
jgi:FixJ family two-component response regulator